ncbi:MAG TPA: Hsp70 family protein [Dactylosporangium sp.]|nr:Hsp70 family protein [Dactylosporangium sp.]
MDWLPGGQRRLRKAVDALPSLFARDDDERAAAAYRDAVRLALPADPALARGLVRDYDARVPAPRYPFRAPDEPWLLEHAARDDADALEVVFAVAVRAGLPAPQRAARDRLLPIVGPTGDADALVTWLRRWRAAGLLDRDALAAALHAHTARRPLDDHAHLWRAFLQEIPEPQLPELFEVYRILGHGAEAVRLADTPDRRARAIECCLASSRPADVRAGLQLAAQARPDAVPPLHQRLGELLLIARDHEAALAEFRAAGRDDLASECLEALGRPLEALAGCPAGRPDRLARLAGLCLPDVDALVEQGRHADAIRLVRTVEAHLGRADPATDAVAERLADAGTRRAAVLVDGRRHHRAAGDHAAWSRFEEEAGEPGEAAVQAELGGDVYRAHRLFRLAGRFGDADRVLRDDGSAASVEARAEAREAGGDPIGAARLYRGEGRPERAAELFERAGDPASAAACLIEALGDEALADPRLGAWLRRAGAVDELARLCLQALERGGEDARARAAEELRRLQHDPALDAGPREEAAAALDRLGAGRRRAFEQRVQAWVAQARFETDARFAGIWALDLGTTTCAAAIYDSGTGKAVLCPWKGRPQYPSTLSLDKDGNELVGLTGEEVFAGWLAGHIQAAKRRMGTGTRYRVRSREYRAEEIAARLIGHGRGLVETYLAERVRERVADLARAELGDVEDDWLTWTERHHDLRIERPRVLVTIPAYFLNNAKRATRDACRIAGLDLVRLIHEPTAACMTAARERRLAGRIVVVDLGAGTLDVSCLDVDEGVYDVQQVAGDTAYGGKDFDAVISRALAVQLRNQGIEVPETGTARRRLDVAAEYLKVALSAQRDAEYVLRDLAGGRDARLELGTARLAELLAEPLAALRRTCEEFRRALPGAPDHLVLVGGPMLSPLVRGVVEEAFGLTRTPVPDPRTAVATGAALQAAVLSGKLSEVLLLDVTPLALGLRVVDDADNPVFSELIPANARIPTQARDTYTTRSDDQTAVDIEIYNGSLDAVAKVGQFRLGDIPAAPRGVPQIEVTFAIDASCVLEVTAQDLASGRSRSIRITDSTVLSPGEIDDMARRRRLQQDVHELREDLTGLLEEADTAAEDARASWGELRTRMGVHRPGADAADPAGARVIEAAYADAEDVGRQLTDATAPLADLAANTRTHLARDPGADPAAALAEGRHLARELRAGLQRLRDLLARVAAWNAAFVRAATAAAGNTDPAGPLSDPDDARRLLAGLAARHDAEGYAAALRANASLLGITVPAEAEVPALVHQVLTDVTRTHPDGTRTTRRGFAVQALGVVTNRQWLGDAAPPTLTAGGAPVEAIEAAAGAADVVLLRGPALDGLRVGHPGLVRVGDRVWAAGTGGTVVSGVVDGLETFAEQDLRVLRTGLPLAAAASGGPLVNDLGEVVGVLTIASAHDGGPVYAVTADAIPGTRH